MCSARMITALQTGTRMLAAALLVLALPDLAGAQVEFVRNDGQWHKDVRFRADVGGGRVYVEDARLTFVMSEFDQIHLVEHHSENDEGLHLPDDRVLGEFAYRVEFVGAQPGPSTGRDKAGYYHNYFLTDDTEHWRSNVPVFGSVLREAAYPGIDLRLHSRDMLLEYDFILQPGADAGHIRLKHEGVNDVRIIDGQLYLETPLGSVVELAPVAYQEGPDGRTDIRARFEQFPDGSVGFSVLDDYDASLELVIDPVLVFCTYTGSTSDNWGFTATYDAEGNLYAGGMVSGSGYPATIGAFDTIYNGGVSTIQTDISISKFSPDGSSLIYATYLGGSQNELPHSIIVNEAGELIVYGTTGSADYPVTLGAYDVSFNGGTPAFPPSNINYLNGSDIIITKMNAAGTNLIGSTFFGGTGTDGLNVTGFNSLEYNYGDFARGDVAVAGDGDIIIASCTFSDDVEVSGSSFQPVKDAGLSGLIARFNNDLTELDWATYLGGGGDDVACSIELDGDELVIGGGTASPDLPGMTGIQSSFNGGQADGFLIRLTDDGTTSTGGTYVGTSAYDQIYFVDLDRDGNVYGYGQSLGDYPISDGIYGVQNASQFIHRFNSGLTVSELSTTFGSPHINVASKVVNTSPTAFLVDNCNNIYCIGWGGTVNNGYNGATGNTNNMETTPDAFDDDTDGSDFYLIVLEGGAENLLFATYFGEEGGRGDHVDGGTSRFDKNGFVYHGSCASCGGTQDFPTTPGAYSESNGSFNCNMGSFKIQFDFAPLEAVTEADPVSGCPPLEVTFSNSSNLGGDYFFWDFGDGMTSNEENPEHTFTEPGVYDIQFIVIDSANCVIGDTAYTQVTVIDSADQTIADFDFSDTLCLRSNIQFENLSQNAANFLWDFGDGTTSEATDPLHTFTSVGNYTVTLIADPGSSCSDTISRDVVVLSNVMNPSFSFVQPDCSDTNGMVQFSDMSGSILEIAEWFWDFGDGTFSGEQNPLHSYTMGGTYDVILTITDIAGCTDYFAAEVLVDLNGFVADFEVQPNCDPLTFGISFFETGSQDNVVSWVWDFGDGNLAFQQNPVHIYNAEGTYPVTLILLNDLGCLDTVTQMVDVFTEDLMISFTTDSIECNDPTVTFNNTSPGADSVVAWEWNFGDGLTSDEENPVHIYAAPGTYFVTLTAESVSGCVTEQFMSVYIPLLDVDFSFDLPPGCSSVNQPVAFNIFGTTSNAITGAEWDFGDGTIEQGFSTTHIYTMPGEYEVLYTITNLDGCIDTSMQTVVISDSLRINAAYQSEDCGTNALTVDFSIDLQPTGMVDMIDWDFGDGNTSSGEVSPSHTYSAPGNYTVYVEVLTTDGCMSTQTLDVEVTAESVDAEFLVDDPPCNTYDVTFLNTTSPADSIISWLWDFGDGDTSGMENPVHTYAGDGVYTVVLTAVSASGCAYTFDSEVLVTEVSTALPDTLAICSGESVLLPLTANFGETILWDPPETLNDPTILQPTATPTITTLYTVSVSEVFLNGDTCRQTENVLVEVNEAASITAGADDYLLPPGGSTGLFATGGFVSYSWDPPTGLDDAGIQDPTATVTEDITYEVTAVDANGCIAVDTVRLEIEDVEECALETLFVPSAFSPNNDGQNDVFRVQIEGDYDRFDLRIHDRWGGLIFETDDPADTWDGRRDGRMLSTDAFGYTLEIFCGDAIVQRQGNITLVR